MTIKEGKNLVSSAILIEPCQIMGIWKASDIIDIFVKIDTDYQCKSVNDVPLVRNKRGFWYDSNWFQKILRIFKTLGYDEDFLEYWIPDDPNPIFVMCGDLAIGLAQSFE